MIEENQDLKLLEMDKCRFYNCCFTKDDCIIRTGIVNCDNIFENSLHSILRAYSQEYYNLDDIDRINFVKKFKKNILNISPKINLNNEVNIALDEIYHFLENYKEPNKVKITNKIAGKTICNIISKDLKFYLLFLRILPLDKIKILFSFNKEKLTINITEYLFTLDDLNNLNKNKLKIIKDKIINFFIEIYTYINEFYPEKLLEENIENIEILDIISNKLKNNIFIIDNNMLYMKSNTFYDKYIILLKIGKKYEILGKLLENNKVKRQFDINDEIIIYLQNDNKDIIDTKDNNEIIENSDDEI